MDGSLIAAFRSAPCALLFVFGYMVGLFALSSIPDNGDSGFILGFVTPTIQNLLHIPVYGLLALLWIFTLRAYGSSGHRSILLAILLSAAYGGIMEFWQLWIPGRFASLMDFFLNVTGILLFTWIYRVRYQRSAAKI